MPLLNTVAEAASAAEPCGPMSPTWQTLIQDFLSSSKGMQLQQNLLERQASQAIIYPADPFRAFKLTPFEQVKVTILGQDPYHGPGQAQGLAFSVPQGVRIPPSLRNILKEVQNDIGPTVIQGGDLQPWATQGVLLLNTLLTVEQGQPLSHRNQGWEILTDKIVAALAADRQPKVFMLWGASAQSKVALIESSSEAHHHLTHHHLTHHHLILQANHPSPLSALRPPIPFLGCKHFSQANHFLEKHRVGKIDW